MHHHAWLVTPVLKARADVLLLCRAAGKRRAFVVDVWSSVFEVVGEGSVYQGRLPPKGKYSDTVLEIRYARVFSVLQS